jgi:hypothetical protein
MGSVYKQPDKREDGSCHSWRAPSKWKGVQRGVKGGSKGSKGSWKRDERETTPCIYVIVTCAEGMIED